jgi:gamma-butyrobetaine dioxygenase/trimethyllysine dioxygenase
MGSVLSPLETERHLQLHDTWLRVLFSNAPGDHADYHYQWLRHNCDFDRHPQTGERTVCSSELPDNPRPLRAWVDAEARLHVAWEGDREERVSVYALAWLRDHAYALGRVAVATPPNDPETVTVRVTESDAVSLVPRLLPIVEQHGLVVVRGFGKDTEAIIAGFEANGLAVRPTHFGRIEDLRTDNSTNVNTDQLGYTNYPVKLHTDQPFLEEPPQYQLLQCMRKADIGGENYLVDAGQVARNIESIDQRAYELLSTVNIRFHRKQKNFEKTLDSPLFQFTQQGFRIRYSYFTMAPHNVPFALMQEWYRAYNLFANLVNDPKNQYSVALEPGDFVLYNNLTTLHARNGFTGARWMRGVYFDRA